MQGRNIFVTGTGTEIGKTVTSAVLVEALKADYWKPVQAGDLDYSDTMKVKELVSNSQSKFHRESYRLNHPMSPHAAAQLDGITIDPERIQPPDTTNSLIIEGAGGLMVPLNDSTLIFDLIGQFEAEVLIVIRNYLGSINHSLLTIDAVKLRNLNITGIIFNGDEVRSSEEYILKYSNVPFLGRIPEMELTPNNIRKIAENFNSI